MSPSKPSEDAIRRRAHEIWQRRGSKPGSAIEDWLRAERELTAEAARSVAPAPKAYVPPPKALVPPPKPPAPAPSSPSQRAPAPPRPAPPVPSFKSAIPSPPPAASPAASSGRPRDARNGRAGSKSRKKK